MKWIGIVLLLGRHIIEAFRPQEIADFLLAIALYQPDGVAELRVSIMSGKGIIFRSTFGIEAVGYRYSF